MKAMNVNLRFWVITLSIMIAISFGAVIPAYSGGDDKSDRLSNEQSSVFSPGYINAIKQRAEEIARQVNSGKNLSGQMEDVRENKLSGNIEQKAADKPMPELKKKTGGGGDATLAKNRPTGQITDAQLKILTESAGTGQASVTLDNGNTVKVCWGDDGRAYFDVLNSAGEKISSQAFNLGVDSRYCDGPEVHYDIVDAGNGRFGVLFTSYEGHPHSVIQIYGQDADKHWDVVSSNNFDLSSVDGGFAGLFMSLGNGTFIFDIQTYNNTNNYLVMTDDTLKFDLNDTSRVLKIDSGSLQYTGEASWIWNNNNMSKNFGISTYTSLGDGKIAIGVNVTGTDYWRYGYNDYDANFLQILDTSSGKFSTMTQKCVDSRTWDSRYGSTNERITDIRMVDNGEIAVVTDFQHTASFADCALDVNVSTYGINFRDGNITKLNTYDVVKGMGEAMSYIGYAYITGIYKLGDGSLVIGVNTSLYSYISWDTIDSGLVSILTTDGRIINVADNSLGDGVERTVADIVSLGDSTFGVVWSDQIGSNTTGYSYKDVVERYSSSGNNVSLTAPIMLSTNTNRLDTSNLLAPMKADSGIADNMKDLTTTVGEYKLSTFTESLDMNKFNSLMSKEGVNIDPGVAIVFLNALNQILNDKDFLDRYGSFLSENGKEIDVMSVLMNILKNPTEDQKLMLDVTEALLIDMKNIEQGSGSPELAKATDDLLQMVAQALLAQAIPDLLKEGDVTSIKGIFSDLDVSKNKIMLDYQTSVKPYYNEVIKDLLNNMAALQAKNILSNAITKEELEKLPPVEIDKILKKLRASKGRSFEIEYVLQQESKYNKRYLEPNKKLFEDHMKVMMKDFTGRMSKVLQDSGVVKTKDKGSDRDEDVRP